MKLKATVLTCLKYGLGPLLWLQGQAVRRRTPILPEPEGDRIGTIGEGQPLSVLIMGDSSAAGVGVEQQQTALLGHVLKALEKDHHINYELRARTGAKTTDALLDLNRALTDEWRNKPDFDVVITALGVNDVTGQVGVSKWLQQQRKLIQSIHQNLKPKLLIISGLPPMHRFPALPSPLREYMGAWAGLFNQYLQQLTTQYPATTFISVQDLPLPIDVAIDGFHPGPKTYRQWGLAVAELIRQQV